MKNLTLKKLKTNVNATWCCLNIVVKFFKTKPWNISRCKERKDTVVHFLIVNLKHNQIFVCFDSIFRFCLSKFNFFQSEYHNRIVRLNRSISFHQAKSSDDFEMPSNFRRICHIPRTIEVYAVIFWSSGNIEQKKSSRVTWQPQLVVTFPFR